MTAVSQDRAAGPSLRGFLFAFGAAFAYGASQVITRQGVSDLAPPLVGAAIAMAWGTLGFFLLSARSLGAPSADLKRGLVLFTLAGVFAAIGIAGLFLALERAQVVVVSPVVSTNPLFTLLLAAVFLRDVERLSWQVILGSLLVVAGVIVLTAA